MMKKIKGFSLIELLVALGIVGIIAAVALPSYTASIQKSRRADVYSALTKGAMLQQRFYTENNSFSNSMANLGGSTSEDGYYTISVATSCSGSCFTLSATPVIGKSQDKDETCWTMTLTQTGRKSSSTKAGVVNPNNTCW